MVPGELSDTSELAQVHDIIFLLTPYLFFVLSPIVYGLYPVCLHLAAQGPRDIYLLS
jgi:hypothetical protein